MCVCMCVRACVCVCVCVCVCACVCRCAEALLVHIFTCLLRCGSRVAHTLGDSPSAVQSQIAMHCTNTRGGGGWGERDEWGGCRLRECEAVQV